MVTGALPFERVEVLVAGGEREGARPFDRVFREVLEEEGRVGRTTDTGEGRLGVARGSVLKSGSFLTMGQGLFLEEWETDEAAVGMELGRRAP